MRTFAHQSGRTYHLPLRLDEADRQQLQAVAEQAADCGVRDVLTLTFPMAPAFEEQRRRAYEGVTQLVQRAQAAGALRLDFVPEALVLLLLANAGVVQGTREAAPVAWQRFVALLLEALRAERAHPLPPPPTSVQMYRALLRSGCGGARGSPAGAARAHRTTMRRSHTPSR
jgi:hypothetical protein